ncbi:MAG: hypothetical protein ACYC06_06545 [Ilumatobacteraceae bacterium]
MEIRQPIISSSRMEAIVTETQDEDLNKPATIGTVRMLAVHVDAGFTQLHSGFELLAQRIDHVEDKLTQRIDSSAIELKAQMSANLSTVMDQFALRSSSDRFIKVGFGVAVLGVLIQTAFAALK